MSMIKISSMCLIAVAALAGCGGGGGSGGESSGPYSITLRTDKTQLPLNAADVPPGIGTYNPFTTTLYVQATESGRPIPGGESVFACNMQGGLESGALYYLDGNSEHETQEAGPDGQQIKIPKGYRSVTLGANSGGNSFHFHAGRTAGTSTITCSVNDPRDKKMYSASVNISVGVATGRPASVLGVTQAPHYLGTKNNLSQLDSTVVVQARVMDDANQPIGNPGAPNVRVSIQPTTDAARGARLLGPNGSFGSSIEVATLGGVAQFALSSGTQSGPVVLVFTTDRSDNNVANGIQDPISSLLRVNVFDQLAAAPLALVESDLGELVNGQEFVHALAVTGGLPPYTWTVSGLPTGLQVDSSGVISGIPKAPPGTYRANVAVTDKNGNRAFTGLIIKLTGDQNVISPDEFTIEGCSAQVNNACRIPNAIAGVQYVYAFSATALNVVWEFAGLPSWLSGGTTGANGFVSGLPKEPTFAPNGAQLSLGDCGVHQFLVTARRGSSSVTRTASVEVLCR